MYSSLSGYSQQTTDQASYQTSPLGNGRHGNIQTLQAMASFVLRDISDPEVVELANSIISSVPSHDDMGEVKAIFNWVRDNIRYRKHPLNAQWVQDAIRTFKQYGSADCTSQSVILSTLLGSVGYESRFVTCGFDYGTDEFDHVYVQACVNGQWVSLDPCNKNAMAGWETDCASRAAYEFFQVLNKGMGDDSSDFSFDSNDLDYLDFGGGASVDSSSYDPTLDPNNYDDLGNYYDPNNGFNLSDPFAGNATTLDPSNGGGVSPGNNFGDDLQKIIDSITGGTGDINQTITDQAGNEYVTLPDNSKVIFFADGSQATYDANGNPTGVTTVNADGTITDLNPQTGHAVTYDSNGNIVGNQPQTPAQQSFMQKALNSVGGGSGSGGGGGMSLGGGGAQKAQTAATTTTAQPSLANTISSIASSISNALRGVTGTTAGLQRVINPATGQSVLINPATGQIVNSATTGTGAALSLTSSGLNLGGGLNFGWTTLLIIGLAIYAMKK